MSISMDYNSNEPHRPGKEIFVVLNEQGYDKDDSLGKKSNTTIHLIHPAGQFPKIEVHNKYNTRFVAIENWEGKNNASPKIWFNKLQYFIEIICTHFDGRRDVEDFVYMINNHDISYVSIKY